MISKNNLKKAAYMAIFFLIFSLSIPAYAEPADIQNHWARNEINRWIGWEILQGDAKGNFNPDAFITRAEFSAIINRIFKYREQTDLSFSDITGQEWYAADIAKVAAAGVMKGSGGRALPNEPVSRQEAAVMLARAFSLEALTGNTLDKFSDAREAAEWSRDALGAMVERGYMSGKAANILAPAAKATRAEIVKMLDNMVGGILNKPGTYKGEIEGNLIVNSADVVLESMVINGDIYITPGIGEGTVTLNNVSVSGEIILVGVAEDRIIINSAAEEEEPSTAGGEGSGGAGTGPVGGGQPAETMKILSASVCLSGHWIAATEVQADVWEIDVTGMDASASFTDLRVYATDDVAKGKVNYLGFTHSVTFSNGYATANVKSILGPLDEGEPGVSLQSIAEIGINWFTVTIEDGNGNTKVITINLLM